MAPTAIAMDRLASSLRPLFSARELQTLRPSARGQCPLCAQPCGATFRLECSCVVCGHCLDDFHDTAGAEFECPTCGGHVTTFEVAGTP